MLEKDVLSYMFSFLFANSLVICLVCKEWKYIYQETFKKRGKLTYFSDFSPGGSLCSWYNSFHGKKWNHNKQTTKFFIQKNFLSYLTPDCISLVGEEDFYTECFSHDSSDCLQLCKNFPKYCLDLSANYTAEKCLRYIIRNFIDKKNRSKILSGVFDFPKFDIHAAIFYAILHRISKFFNFSKFPQVERHINDSHRIFAFAYDIGIFYQIKGGRGLCEILNKIPENSKRREEILNSSKKYFSETNT